MMHSFLMSLYTFLIILLTTAYHQATASFITLKNNNNNNKIAISSFCTIDVGRINKCTTRESSSTIFENIIPKDITMMINKQSRKTTTVLTRRFASLLPYDEPVFRPPAEWRSLILQVTIGCSWNKCTFCEMYQEKQFHIKSLDDIEIELQTIVQSGQATYVKDIFLADGDAMMLPTKHLLQLLQLIHQYIPNVRRISSYCLPRNLRNKSVHEDLIPLKHAGLSLVYVGCESGNNDVLRYISKGETYDTSLDALTKLQDAGIKRSVMILLGLGGKNFSNRHAIDSAKLCSATNPEYLSVLTTSFPRGLNRIKSGFVVENNNSNKAEMNNTSSSSSSDDKNSNTSSQIEEEEQQQQDRSSSSTTSTNNKSSLFQPLSPRESLYELKLFLELIDIPSTTGKTIFRSDHASNYLILKGRLGRDKNKLLQQVTNVLNAPEDDDHFNLRPEWARSL